ncbi:MAG TPA: peptidoglycan DD-metalloendopeptidase family protein [Thermomicrobiales bacterium]
MRYAVARRSARGGRARAFTVGLVLALAMSMSVWPQPEAAAEFEVTVNSVEQLSGLTAMVAHSEDGVNLRAEPGVAGEVIDALPDGTIVELRIDVADTVVMDDIRWWPVRVNGVEGWIAGLYLTSADSSGSRSSSRSAETPWFSAGDYVAVVTDDGTGLNIRAGAGQDFERIGFLGEGDVVQVLEGPEYDDDGNGWYLITDGDVTGYVFAGYLAVASEPAPPDDEPVLDEIKFAIGDYATPLDNDGVNIRRRGWVGSEILGVISPGSIVRIVGSAVFDDNGDAWYKVDDGNVRGYALGDLLGASDPPAPPPPPSGPTGTFIYPVGGSWTFTQAYGCTGLAIEPYDARIGCNFHNGIDLAAPAYTPIIASDGGVVVAAGWCDCGLGYYVEIDHQNGYSTVYGHMAEQPYVAVGQRVNQGDVIGPIGSTGWSTGPHVHFIIKANGSTVDPLAYLP